MLATLSFENPMPDLGGRRHTLTLAQRMEIRKRAKAVGYGQRYNFFATLAKEFKVSLRTIKRTVYG